MLTNLSIGRYGRFANALFQIAAVIGIARKSGQPYAFPPFINWDHKERFGSTEDIELDKYFVNPLPRLCGDYPYFQKKEYSWGYHDIHLPTGNWDLAGHFQSEKYFKHCIDEVRHYMRLKKEAFGPQRYVGVHVRRGDYDDKYHTILRVDYYKKAIESFGPDMDFAITSDDLDACAQMLYDMRLDKAYRVHLFRHGGDYIGDFAFLKMCQGFICANSSYSLMAAILSEAPEKKIVCPSNWWGPAWNPDTKDLYPENAIVI